MISFDNLYNNKYYEQQIGCALDSISSIDFETENRLKYRTLYNASIIPYTHDGEDEFIGIIDQSGNYLPETSVHYGFFKESKINVNHLSKANEKVIFLGSWLNCWGHWITDNIKYIWFLYTNDYLTKYSEYKLVYVSCWNDSKYVDSIYQLLELLDIDAKRLIEIKEPTQFSEVILPDECFFVSKDDGSRYHTKEYLSLIDKIGNNLQRVIDDGKLPKYDKVYFSYAKAGRKKQIGEYRLEKYFEELGYKIIYPENISLYEQLYILRNCNYFCSTEGSCSHNIIFMNKKTNIYLIPRANYFTGYQMTINSIINKRYNSNIYYIDSSLSYLANPEAPWCGPFLYVISNELVNFFNHNKRRINYIDLILYTLLGAQNNIEPYIPT